MQEHANDLCTIRLKQHGEWFLIQFPSATIGTYSVAHQSGMATSRRCTNSYGTIEPFAERLGKDAGDALTREELPAGHYTEWLKLSLLYRADAHPARIRSCHLTSRWPPNEMRISCRRSCQRPHKPTFHSALWEGAAHTEAGAACGLSAACAG